MSSIGMVLGFATSLNLKLEQLDVKTAFLHGDLKENIYMEQPEGGRLQGERDRAHGLQIEKEYVWVEASTNAMVQEVWHIHGTSWLP